MKNNYFKTTFVLVFVFLFVIRIVDQLFEGINTLTAKFFLKTLIASLVVALMFGTLNHFLKIDIYKKK